MEREQKTVCSGAEEFVSLLQKLDEKQQLGICLMTEGMKMLADKQKSGCKNR